MNNRIFGRPAAILLMTLGLIISACGILEIEVEPLEATPVPTVPAMQTANTEEALAVPSNTPIPTTAPLVEPTPTATTDQSEEPTPPEEPAPSEITYIDETWSRYTNYKLGFSILIPRVKTNAFGACAWNEENGDHSYRPRYALVPVKVFEDGNTVYITSEYQHVLSGETRETGEDGGTRFFFSECEAVENSLESLRDPDAYQEMWALVVEEVTNDQELETFINERYGEGCSLGDKIESSQAGVFDVTIQGDGKDLAETSCPVNFGTVIKYYPEGNKVVAWNTGQAYTFAADVNNEVTRDQEMIDSFLFLTGEESS